MLLAREAAISAGCAALREELSIVEGLRCWRFLKGHEEIRKVCDPQVLIAQIARLQLQQAASVACFAG